MKKAFITVALVLIAPLAFTQTEVEVKQTRHNQPQQMVQRDTQTTTVHQERAEHRNNGWFFHGKELRRGSPDRDDIHLRIGTHDRTWWHEHYRTVVLIDGCWYYMDAGRYFPAYGYDPSCNYPEATVYFGD